MDATRTQSPISRSDRTALWITITVDYAAIAAIASLAAIGVAFQQGQRLQRDTEGLV
jgi:fatty acid desaturase